MNIFFCIQIFRVYFNFNTFRLNFHSGRWGPHCTLANQVNCLSIEMGRNVHFTHMSEFPPLTLYLTTYFSHHPLPPSPPPPKMHSGMSEHNSFFLSPLYIYREPKSKRTSFSFQTLVLGAVQSSEAVH